MLVFSDLDDTFLAHDKTLPAPNLHALDALVTCGYGFVPCTGRAAASLPPQLAAHPSLAAVVACNGARVFDATGNVVRHMPMPVAVVRAAYEVLAPLDVTFDLFVDTHVYAERTRLERALADYGLDAGTAAMLRAVREPRDATVLELLADLGGAGVDKVTVYGVDAPTRDAAAAALNTVVGIGVTSSHPCNLEFMAAGVDKGEALAWVAARASVGIERTIAFGDSPNDLGMLRVAGTGVAVANATPQVRAAADEVCGSCEVGGPGSWLLTRLGMV